MAMITVNVLAVVLGTAIGCVLRHHISNVLKENIMLYFSIVSASIGILLLNKAVNLSAATLAFLVGGMFGHLLGLDRRLSGLTRLLPGDGAGSTLLIAFTLYCVSTPGILGALSLGFEGDPTVLITKAIMDFLASIFFASTSGWVLSLIGLPLAVILLGLYGLSGVMMPHLTPAMIGDFSACGGMIQLLNALRITKLKDPPVSDFIPSLILVFPISWLWMTYL